VLKEIVSDFEKIGIEVERDADKLLYKPEDSKFSAIHEEISFNEALVKKLL
jgi:hypothetical protein